MQDEYIFDKFIFFIDNFHNKQGLVTPKKITNLWHHLAKVKSRTPSQEEDDGPKSLHHNPYSYQYAQPERSSRSLSPVCWLLLASGGLRSTSGSRRPYGHFNFNQPPIATEKDDSFGLQILTITNRFLFHLIPTTWSINMT